MSEREKHPSFAVIDISRTSGNSRALFGSSIKHDHTIRITIAPASVKRQLNHESYMKDGQPYLTLEMSQSQFAEAITSMNGSGVPATLIRLNGKEVEPAKHRNQREIFEDEFYEAMSEIKDRMFKLTETAENILSEKKSITKADRNTIIQELNALKMEIGSNIPYMMNAYNEKMDEIATATKAEVEAFTINRLNNLGMDKLQELIHDQQIQIESKS